MQNVLDILEHNPVGVLATINADGTPWTTPLHLLYDQHYVYWISASRARHSQNVAVRPQASLSIWSPDETKGLTGLFIQSHADLADSAETERVHKAFADRFGAVSPTLSGAAAYRMAIGKLDAQKSFGNCYYTINY